MIKVSLSIAHTAVDIDFRARAWYVVRIGDRLGWMHGATLLFIDNAITNSEREPVRVITFRRHVFTTTTIEINCRQSISSRTSKWLLLILDEELPWVLVQLKIRRRRWLQPSGWSRATTLGPNKKKTLNPEGVLPCRILSGFL